MRLPSEVWPVRSCCIVKARCGEARRGAARRGKARVTRLAYCGSFPQRVNVMARQGEARQGTARRGMARQGKARVLRHMVAVPQIVKAWPGKVRQGTARRGVLFSNINRRTEL